VSTTQSLESGDYLTPLDQLKAKGLLKKPLKTIAERLPNNRRNDSGLKLRASKLVEELTNNIIMQTEQTLMFN